jgi:alkanesulfonate monooxygenase
MHVELFWNIIAQDGRYPWSTGGQRMPTINYLRQIATASEIAGFDGALIATQPGATDPWGLASALVPVTDTLKFIVAQYAGTISPLWLAQAAATLDQYSNGRLIINIITGVDRGQQALGNFLSKDERYVLGDEYWDVFSRIMTGEEVTYEGKYVKVKNAHLLLDTVQPKVELMFGGSSPAALKMAARRCDTWLCTGLTPEVLKQRGDEVRALAAAEGRTIRCGLRMHVIVRETAEAAWAQAQYLYDHMDREALDRHRARTQGQKGVTGIDDMQALLPQGDLPADARALEFSPNLWAGIGLVRLGPGVAIVGDPETVAAMIRAYEAVGIEVFILSGYPHVEEAHRFGDLVMPLLRDVTQSTKPSWW